VAPRLTRWHEFVNSIQSVHTFLNEIIEAHKRKFIPHELKDFIDDYLKEIENTTDPNSTFYKDVGGKETGNITILKTYQNHRIKIN